MSRLDNFTRRPGDELRCDSCRRPVADTWQAKAIHRDGHLSERAAVWARVITRARATRRAALTSTKENA